MFRILVRLGCQVPLYNGLVGSVFLQGIKGSIDDHHPDGQVGQAEIIGPDIDLSHGKCLMHGFYRSGYRTE